MSLNQGVLHPKHNCICVLLQQKLSCFLLPDHIQVKLLRLFAHRWTFFIPMPGIPVCRETQNAQIPEN